MSSLTIEARELSKRYGHLVAVDQLSFEVGAGEVLGFLGPNGAGKTTTISMLCGLLRPTAGSAEIAGFDIGKEPQRVKQQIGVFKLFQSGAESNHEVLG